MANTRELSQLASVISVADETRNVGIGTTTPTSKLHVSGDVRVSGVVTATTFVGDGSALTGISGGSSSQFVTTTAGIHTLSNVGIGTTTPTSKLHVIGDVRVSGVVTATTFLGALTGTASSTTNIPNLTGAITSNNTTTSLGSFTSAQLATALTDETGSGSAVFATSPTLVTPVLGSATATSIVVGSGVTINASGINASGIVTALGGIRGIGIYSGGNLVTTGIITALNFIGTGNTFVVTNNKIDISISGGSQVSVGTASPASPSSGNLWYNTNLGRTFIYYNDGDSSQWVDAAPFNIVSDSSSAASVSIGTEAPVGPTSGDLWYNADYARIFVYYDNGINSQWVDAAPFNYADARSVYADNAGIATYASNAGIATFSTSAGISTFSTSAGIATYASNAGIATFSTSAGISTSVIGGIGSITQLQVTGISTFTNGPILVGTGTSTGTSSQPLQVSGGAYVSGNLGVGVTNPASRIDVWSTTSGSTAIRATSSPSFSSTLYPGVISGLSTTGSGFPNFAASGIGVTSGEIGVYSFFPTFTNFPADRGPRRAVDLVGGFATSTWGTEYFAINVGRNGAANDSSILTNERLRVDGSGNVGIGTTTPTSKLHVIGDVRVTGVVTATSFVGSGANLTGVISGVEIKSAGTSVGTGITNINFVGATATATGSASTITITVTASFNELDVALFS